MKKVFIALAVLLVIGGLGGLVYLLLGEGSSPSVQASAPESASSSSNQAQTKDKQGNVGVTKPVETPADAMEAIAYEKSQNQDTVGWLRVPSTSINNSVLQSYNNVYYLRTNERRQQDIYGCYFADYECSFGSREELSPNTVIFGHSNLKDDSEGPRFSQLFKFSQESFAKNTPVLYFSTAQDYMAWQIFSVFYTDVDMDYIRPNQSEAEQAKLIEEAKSKSLYAYNVPVGGTDKILTLSTCTEKYGDDGKHRFVVMAKLVPDDAMIPVTADLTANPNPVLPKGAVPVKTEDSETDTASQSSSEQAT